MLERLKLPGKLWLLSCTLAGCINLQQVDVPEAVQLVDESWQQVEAEPLPDFDTLLGSDELKQVVQQALQHNQDIVAAAARLEAARRSAGVASGARWPGFDVSLDQSTNERNDIETDTANLLFGLSWEVDIWGRVAATAKSAKASADEQQELYRAAQFSLAAQVVKLWFDTVEARQQLALSEARTSNLQNSLDTIRDGFESGIRTAFEVYSARAELANNQALAAQRRQILHTAERNLAVLLGRPPQLGIAAGEELPDFVAAIPSGLSIALIERRPDIKAATYALVAQHADVGAAFANRLPAIRLTGSDGASSDKLSDVLSGDHSVWSVFGGITVPLFQGGALLSEQRRQEALLNAEIAEYKQTVLVALSEVEQTIDNETLFSLQEQSSSLAVKASLQAEEQALEQYISGISNLNTWLQAQRTSFDRQSNLLQIRSTRLKNRVDLYLALGGDFGNVE